VFFGVSSSDQAAVPAPSFNRVFELFFLNEMSRRTDTHCQQGKNTGPRTPPFPPPQGWGENKRWIRRPGGRGRVDPTPFVWRGVSKKKCDTSSWFFGGDPSMFGTWTFWIPDVFFQFFCFFVILLCFGLKKDSSYKHPDSYDNPIHPSPLPRAYNNFTAKRPHEEKTPRTNSRKKLWCK
jgi:hypothetical protein